jgi:aspartate/methionine/tyrosine aminotransferase
VRALVVINPGNPSGSVLPRKNIEDIVRLCYRERLALQADEAYQENIYFPEMRPFVSAKRVVCEIEIPFGSIPLFGFHSASKGAVGEGGRRGGYVGCVGFDETVIAQIFHCCSVSLCLNIQGQIAMDLFHSPPQPDDESFALHKAEQKAINELLKRRTVMTLDALNSM